MHEFDYERCHFSQNLTRHLRYSCGVCVCMHNICFSFSNSWKYVYTDRTFYWLNKFHSIVFVCFFSKESFTSQFGMYQFLVLFFSQHFSMPNINYISTDVYAFVVHIFMFFFRINVFWFEISSEWTMFAIFFFLVFQALRGVFWYFDLSTWF